MTAFLTALLRLSLLGSLLAGVLFLLKPVLWGRVSRTASYYLWLLVLLRLCIPAGLTLSLPAADTPVVPSAGQTAAPVQAALADSAAAQGTAMSQTEPNRAVPTPALAAIPPEVVTERLLTGIWAAGFVLVGGWYIHGYCRVRRTILQTAVPAGAEANAILAELELRGGVRLIESAAVNSPLLLGVFRPTVVLPVGITDAARLRDILSHELTHTRRYDLLFKWFAAFAASVHWFNPLLIFIRREIGRACELACDEAVVKNLDAPARKHYGETLLLLAAEAPALPLAVTLCMEKKRLEERLVSIVRTHKRTPAAVLLTLGFVLLLGGCALFTDAAAKPPEAPPAQAVTGFTDPVSGITIQLDMPKSEVERLLGPGYLMSEYPSIFPYAKTDSTYIYTTDAGPIWVRYVDETVLTLDVSANKVPGADTFRWTTESGISCGSTLDEAAQCYPDSEIHQISHTDSYSYLHFQGSTDNFEADTYLADIWSKEEGGVYEIGLGRAKKAITTWPETLKHPSTGAEISIRQPRSEVEALLGPGTDITGEYDGESPSFVYGEGPDTLYVQYLNESVIRLSTYPPTMYGFLPITQPGGTRWQLESLGYGASLDEVQQLLPGGKWMDNPTQGQTEAGAVHQLFQYISDSSAATFALHDGAVIGIVVDRRTA